MARSQEATSTSQAGRKRRPIQGTPSASSIISSLKMEELRAYCDVLDNIDLKLMENLDESTLGEEHNTMFFYPGAPCSRASLPRACPCQAVFAFYQGAAGPRASQHHSDSCWMQCTEPPVLA